MDFKYLSMKMNWEKWNFELIGNSVHTTEYLALGRFFCPDYLKVKKYTNFLSVHWIYCVCNEIILFVFLYFWGFPRPWKLFLCFCFLDDLLRLHFLLDVSIFTTIDDEKKEINSSSIFEGFYLKLRRKFWELINTVDSR